MRARKRATGPGITIRRVKRIPIAAALLASACTITADPSHDLAASFGAPSAFVYESTFRRVLEKAERGDPEGQNALGYMFYRGEGTVADPAQARAWFKRAAAAGSDRAQRNLDFLDSGAPRLPRAQPGRGEVLYARFCAGCHGLQGVAAYENSPSFAFGERLHHSDERLMRSVMDGLQEMPGWEGKLPNADLREILAFVRMLPVRYNAGIAVQAPEPPLYMYLFGKMEERRIGATPFIPR